MAKLTNAQALELLATKTAESTKATQELTALLSGITTKPQDGADGQTPYIKDGNWWIGEQDTGVKVAVQMPNIPLVFKQFSLNAFFNDADLQKLQNEEIVGTEMPIEIKLEVGEEYNGKEATVINDITDGYRFDNLANFTVNKQTVSDGIVSATLPANKLIDRAIDGAKIVFLVCIKNFEGFKADLNLSEFDGAFQNMIQENEMLKVSLKENFRNHFGTAIMYGYLYSISRADGTPLTGDISVHGSITMDMLANDKVNVKHQFNITSVEEQKNEFIQYNEEVYTDIVKSAVASGYVIVKDGNTLYKYNLNSEVEIIPRATE